MRKAEDKNLNRAELDLLREAHRTPYQLLSHTMMKMTEEFYEILSTRMPSHPLTIAAINSIINYLLREALCV